MKEIIYDRRFIKVGDKYIPIFQYAWENDYELKGKRKIFKKQWDIFNDTKGKQYLFTEEEIKELAKIYEGLGNFYKSSSTPFKKGEFEKYFINGIRGAKPLEFYLENKNSLFIEDWTDMNNKVVYKVNSTTELLELLDKLNGRLLSIYFGERKLNLPKRKKDHFFVLKHKEKGQYLLYIRKHFYVSTDDKYEAKKFNTRKEAIRYRNKYYDRLRDFEVEQVKDCMVDEHGNRPCDNCL